MDARVQLTIEDKIARLTLCRPPLNIIDIATMKEMRAAVAQLSEEPQLRVLIVEAQPGSRAFSAGVDIEDHLEDKAADMLKNFHEFFYALQDLSLPTLAVVDGPALGGGCELAAFCDMIIASEEASFGQPEIKVGVFAPVATALLLQRLPRATAVELLLTGDTITAEEAHRIGLVNRVVPRDQLAEAVHDFTNRLTSLSAPVLRVARQAIRAAESRELRETLERLEQVYLEDLLPIPDSHEGLVAFLEKREPRWE